MYPINTCIFCGQASQTSCADPKNLNSHDQEEQVEAVSFRVATEPLSKSQNIYTVFFDILFKRMRSELNASDLSSLLNVNKFFKKEGESEIGFAWKGVLLNFSQNEHLSRNILKLSAMKAKKICSQIKELKFYKKNKPTLTCKTIKKIDIENPDFVFGAVCNNSSELLKILLDSGADMRTEADDTHSCRRVKATSRIHYDLLATSIDLNHTNCIEVLLNAGANLNDHAFAHLPNLEDFLLMVKELKVRGLIDYPFASNGRNLLLVCITRFRKTESNHTNSKQTALIKIVLGAGADINAKNSDGATALMLAVQLCATQSNTKILSRIIKLLLGAGADVNIKNKKGDTALKLARNPWSQEIAEMLIRAGAEE